MKTGICSITKLVVDKDICINCDLPKRLEKILQKKVICCWVKLDLDRVEIRDYNQARVIMVTEKMKNKYKVKTNG